jgi:hypothetical protein
MTIKSPKLSIGPTAVSMKEQLTLDVMGQLETL